jgi:molybdopterin-guanine dinucleotide biosynthesis protein A
MKLSVVIQAGGESRRMGQNKALVPFLGQPLIQRVISRVATLADELLITSNQPDALAFLQLPTHPDLLPGLGALGGLYTAFAIAQHPLVAVIACDMVFVSAPLLAAQRDVLLNQIVDGAVPRTSAGYEPFHAVYRRETCLAAVKASLDAGMRRADCWYSNVHMAYFSPEQTDEYDPRGEAFININTPEELKRVEVYVHSGYNPR